MRTTLAVTVAPDAEPVTVQQVRKHCRIDHASDDDLLASYVQTARIMAEGYLSRVLITQTLLWTVRPESLLRPDWRFVIGPLELPRAPVQSIASVTVLDRWGNSTALAPAILPIVPPTAFTGYIADLSLDPAQLRIGRATPLIDGRQFRDATFENIQISFVAGYGEPAAVPAPISTAIMMGAAFYYENRGDAGAEMPKAFEALLDRYRLQFLGG
ncbi:MAG TPA: head-tail connector protein [Chloroflexota bacterium]|jgi:uncharacterized phiE125 gp8 family phage protein